MCSEFNALQTLLPTTRLPPSQLQLKLCSASTPAPPELLSCSLSPLSPGVASGAGGWFPYLSRGLDCVVCFCGGYVRAVLTGSAQCFCAQTDSTSLNSVVCKASAHQRLYVPELDSSRQTKPAFSPPGQAEVPALL